MVGRKCEGAFLTVESGKSDCESTLAGAEEDTLPDERPFRGQTHTSSGLGLKPPWSHGWNWGEVHQLSFLLVSKVPPPVPEEAGGGRGSATESGRHPCHRSPSGIYRHSWH